MSDRITLSRRRVLGAAVAAGLASAGAGVGTMAAFSDSESSSDNQITAGTLDLTLDGGEQTVTILDVTGATPGQQGQGSITLGNAGTIAGVPEIEVAALRSSENGYYGAEKGQDGSPNDGELDQYLEVRFSIGGTTVRSRTTADSLSVGDTYTGSSPITGGGSTPLTVEWWLPSNTDSIAQSDGFGFDLTVRLTQQGAP
ncbi:MAG: TasA family protein [Halapricum sp.]